MKNTVPKLAIISTFDDLCGIASYTRSIIKQLEPYFEITVFDLDQYIFRHDSLNVKKLADDEICRVCKELKKFDAVNIQLEHGTFAKNKRLAYKRISQLLDAAPQICITFHTIIESSPLDWKRIWKLALKFNIVQIYKHVEGTKQHDLLGRGLYLKLRTLQRTKHVSVIVHTKRDMKMMKFVERLKNVYDHPLAYFSDQQASQLLAKPTRSEFPVLEDLPKDAVVVGCFGFFGPYKGVDTALKAMKLLPLHYHLVLFGGVHPSSIAMNEPINSHLNELVQLISPGMKLVDGAGGVNLSVDDRGLKGVLEAAHPGDLSPRVHFSGVLTDDQFAHAMIACDVVLLPYLEVGQSASGPAAMAVNLKRNVVASRTKAFLQLSRYYPNQLEFFDVGNYLQLSQILLNIHKLFKGETHVMEYGVESNVEMYKKALLGENYVR